MDVQSTDTTGFAATAHALDNPAIALPLKANDLLSASKSPTTATAATITTAAPLVSTTVATERSLTAAVPMDTTH